MNPTFIDGDMVLVNRLAYFFKKPKAKDIVVIKWKNYIIKRIKAINGEKIFVIGDNKKESTDSREFGWIERKDIVGKVIFKL